ncbi:MAG: hypothetical protein IKH31_05585 [Clostridia bacterium]|nr:hypothetical protein [Clostridia bacterium]
MRLTETEKKKSEAAAKCGLTVSEYMRQRALGYESLDAGFIGTPNLAALQKEELCVITCSDSSCSSKHPYDGRAYRAALFFIAPLEHRGVFCYHNVRGIRFTGVPE